VSNCTPVVGEPFISIVTELSTLINNICLKRLEMLGKNTPFYSSNSFTKKIVYLKNASNPPEECKRIGIHGFILLERLKTSL